MFEYHRDAADILGAARPSRHPVPAPGGGGGMLAAVTAGTGHPAVAVLLGLGAAALAALVVAMAWNVHVRQIRLAGQLARRQCIVAGDGGSADPAGDLQGGLDEPDRAAGQAAAPPVVIDG